jgi:Ca2+-binding RTX toxin-like protein
VISGFETGYVVTGAGNDAFILTGLMPFDVSGGAGFDTLIRNDTGVVGADPDSFVLSAGAWFAGWVGNGQFDGIEQVTATFSDDDNTVFVDAAPLALGAGLNLNGGRGSDQLLIDFSALDGTVFTLGAGGVVSGNRGIYSGFEAFSIGLGGGVNSVTTGGGNDTVEAGHGGASTINTGDGDDQIWGGTGAETVFGGAGVDHFHVSGAAAGFTIVRDGAGGYVLTDVNLADGNQGVDHLANVEWVDFTDGAAALPFYGVGATFTGTAGNDVLTGTAFGDVLLGLAGNDKLVGGDGDDLLNGGAGNDTITGGSGIDTMSYADAAAAVKVNLGTLGAAQITGGSGSDWLVDAMEGLTGSGFADTLTGNALGNRIEGQAGNDTIDGGAGADTLVGGLGNDT